MKKRLLSVLSCSKKKSCYPAIATLLALVFLSLVIMVTNWTIRSFIIAQSASVSQYKIAQARACAEGAIRIAKSICAIHAVAFVYKIMEEKNEISLTFLPELEQELTKEIERGRIILTAFILPTKPEQLSLKVTVYDGLKPLYMVSTDCDLTMTSL